MNQLQLPLRVKVKNLLRSLLPHSAFTLVNKIWIQTGARLFPVQNLVEQYTTQFISEYGRTVQSGPFRGMKYVTAAVGSNYLHKLIGSYEAVLHQYIASILGKKFDTIVDIGSAEGYYLIGLGKLFPEAKLVGFEIELKGRELTKELCDLNQLRNHLQVFGEANTENIAPHLTASTLLVCDCEGAELDILNPTKVPQLQDISTFIIELHDFIRPGIKPILIERFSPTHTVTIVPFAMADVSQFPFLSNIKNKRHQYELCRERGWQEQEWMILEKKAIS